MDTDTKQILAKALLLPNNARKELLYALEASLAESPLDLSVVDFSDIQTMLHNLIEEADKVHRKKRHDDWDVPKLWRSLYYLRQGYHLDMTASSRRDHWQGGDPRHKRAVCPSCGNRLRLLWDIDCTDPRFRMEMPKAFGDLRRLPLYYCLSCPCATIYRCTGKARLQMIPGAERGSEESPFSGFPDAFPRERLVFKAIPPDIENLMVALQLLGDHEWLRPSQCRILAEYLGIDSTCTVSRKVRRSQFGGLPVLQQGYPTLVCPYEECPTHTWGHPLVRKRRYYQMKVLATIDQDAGLAMQSEYAQIVFHICWACQTIHADYQID